MKQVPVEGFAITLTADLPIGSTNLPLPANTLANNPALGTLTRADYVEITFAPAGDESRRETVRITAPVASDATGATITATTQLWPSGSRVQTRLSKRLVARLIAGVGRNGAPANNTVVTFGDSLTGNQGGVSNAGFAGQSWIAYANGFAGGVIDIIRNGGIGGNTTSMMLARIETDVIPYPSAGVIFMTGTNDVSTIGSGGIALGVADANGEYPAGTSKGDFVAIVRRLIEDGRWVGIVIPPPKTMNLPTDAASIARHIAFLEWQREFAVSTPGCFLLGDAYSLFVSRSDTSGAWADVTNAQSDSAPLYLHLNNKGAQALGRQVGARLKQLFTPRNVLPVTNTYNNANNPNDLFTDSLFLAASQAAPAGFTGNVPGSKWVNNSLTNATCAISISPSVRLDEFGLSIGNDMVFDITASAAGVVRLSTQLDSAKFNNFLANGGYKILMGCLAKLVSGTNVTGAWMELLFGSPYPVNVIPLGGLGITPQPLLPGDTLTLLSQRQNIDATMPNAGVFGSYTQLVFNVTLNAAGAAQVRFGAPFVRIEQ